MIKQFVLAGILSVFSFVVNAQEWMTNMKEAKNLASTENKKVLLVFQGSDWCAPCIKMEREIWDSKEFKEYAKTDLILVKADFPRRKKNKLSEEQEKYNKTLAAKYNKGGYFPFVLVLDSSGKVLGQTGYKKMKPKQYIDLFTSY